jgi:hypothetical protein
LYSSTEIFSIDSGFQKKFSADTSINDAQQLFIQVIVIQGAVTSKQSMHTGFPKKTKQLFKFKRLHTGFPKKEKQLFKYVLSVPSWLTVPS